MPEHVSFLTATALPRKRNAVLNQFDKWDKEHRKAAKAFLRSEIVIGRDAPPQWWDGSLARDSKRRR
ncbi:MAG: hypothetical protein DK306_002548 [Chloroflexi bacterium]|nr:MAG: hypothetical protein DK306_002548 [Chloroflexota bacterium]